MFGHFNCENYMILLYAFLDGFCLFVDPVPLIFIVYQTSYL